MTTIRDEIISGMARCAWALAWADHAEETCCTDMSGRDIYDIMPEPTEEAYQWARDVVERIETEEGTTVQEMYARAEELSTDTPERFGACLTYEACGCGVSWADDHTRPALTCSVSADTWALQHPAERECGCMALEVQIRSTDDYIDEEGTFVDGPGPGCVNQVSVWVECRNEDHARAYVEHHQSIGGSSWERCESSVYTRLDDCESLIDDIVAEGYTNLDLSEYCPEEW